MNARNEGGWRKVDIVFTGEHILPCFAMISTSRYDFTISIASAQDVLDIHEFLISDFLYNKSLNSAVGLTEEDACDALLGQFQSN